MYRILTPLLISMLAAPFLNTTVEAQRPFERFQRESTGWRPDGRLLREMFGEQDEEEKKETSPRERDENLWSRSAFGPRIEQPSPNRFRRQNSTDEDATNNRSLFANPRNAREYPENSSKSERYSAYENRNKPHPSKLEVALKRSQDPDGLIVERISKSGAAYLAGIRQGDLLTEVGGLKISNKEELASVLQVLKDGDQMEFAYQRRGRTKTAIVQFGEAQENSSKDRGFNNTSVPRKRDLVEYYNRPKNIEGRKTKSKLDEYFQQNASSRNNQKVPELGNSELDVDNVLDLNWEVSSNRSTTVKPTNASASKNKSEILRLRNELEKKQREIENLQNRMKKTSAASSSYSETELESLFDTDR